MRAARGGAAVAACSCCSCERTFPARVARSRSVRSPLGARRATASTAPDRAMWKGSSRSLFRTLVLENSKFLLFVLTPVFTASLFWNDAVADYIVRSRQYVTYPPEGERPPTTREEVRARHAELRARLDAQAEAEGRRRRAGAAGAG